MTTATTSKYVSPLFTGMIEDAQPMTDFDGNTIAKSGISKAAANSLQIHNMVAHMDDVTMYRDTGKWAVYNVVQDGKAYTIQAEITNKLWRVVKLTWDHRDACDALTASDLWEGAL